METILWTVLGVDLLVGLLYILSAEARMHAIRRKTGMQTEYPPLAVLWMLRLRLLVLWPWVAIRDAVDAYLTWVLARDIMDRDQIVSLLEQVAAGRCQGGSHGGV